MKILVTGANGRVGSKVVEQLLARGVQLRALVRDRIKANFPPMVEVVEGDFLEPDSLRPALAGITSVFLLNAVAGDEVTQALNVLNLIQEAGVRRLVYLSVMHSDRYVNVPHFAGKFAVERMIEQMGISATILHPAYFMENDVRIQQVVSDFGVYPMPIGDIGIAMIDVGDLAAVAAEELVRRSQGPETLPLKHITLVGPQALTGAQVAGIWSEVLQRPIVYGGSDPQGFEANLRHTMPSWLAYDMRLMSERFINTGMVPSQEDQAEVTRILGRPLRTYKEFAQAITA